MEMTLYVPIILCFLIHCSVHVAVRQDSGNLYFPEGKQIELRCQNITEGYFASVYWYSTAYATNTQTTDIYRYDNTEKTFVSEHFVGRIERINETSIRIKKAKLADSGRWKCDILYQPDKNADLKVKSMAAYTVHIVNPPSLIDIQPPVSVMGNLGGQATVFCESQSLSPFEITWHKKIGNFTKNAAIRMDGEIKKGTYTRRVHLDFSLLSKEDTGVYYCVAKNVGGQHNRSVTVRIKSAPRIFNTKEVANIDVYKTGKLVCFAKGYPQIDFQWKILNGKYMLGPKQVVDQLSVSRTVYNSESEQGYSVLTVNVIDKEYLGTYTCIARNIAGNDNRNIELSGLAPPDAPSIIEHLIKAEENRITIYWRLKEETGAPTWSVSIEHRNSSSTKNSWTRYAINKAIRTYTVSGLVKSTSYDFRIRAANEIGESKYSKTVKISTKGDKVPGTNPEALDESDQVLGNLDLTALIGIFGGAFIALLVGFICVCVFVRKMQKNDQEGAQHHNMTASYAPTTLPQHTTVDGRPVMIEMEPLIPNYQLDHWEFPRDRLTVTTVLGAGAFGVVMRGLAEGIKGSVGNITVAVKTVRDSTNEAATKDLCAELNLLKLLPDHPNVVGLLGCCTRAEPIYVIVEYCANGDLQGFLRSSRGIYERYYKTSYGGTVPDLTSKMLLTFAWQIVKGMSHLSSMKVIHRDLAARNILVDDQLICKVSDFGFARDIYVEDHYLKRSAGGRFPIKWMAIESLLDGISTTKSDVWSFGVVLWELVTLGASPYPGMNSYEVVSFLQDGYRMDKPKHCSNEIYQLMMDCWNVAPGRRPSFNDLEERSKDLIVESDDKELINMHFYPDHLYVNFDGAGSQSTSVSTATTPHGTLTRNHVVNMHQQDQLGNGNVPPGTPRTGLRSPSGHNIRNGRTNSVTALSERSVTGQSTSSYNPERGTLVPASNKVPSAERLGLLAENNRGPS